MIQGTNAATKTFDDVDIAIGCGENTNIPMSEVIADLRKRRENVLNGGINCIPLPFPRFKFEFPGIEKEQYIVVTASTKAGKSQFSSYLYLYHVLDYAFEYPDQCSVHIIYFNLEESQMRIKQRYISHLLYKFDEWRLAPTDLRSTSADYPLPEEALELLDTPRYKERLDFFDEHVQFETEETNPTGILRVCEDYAKEIGEYKTYKRRSRSNPNQTIDVFQSYKENDPNHYTIVMIDHVGLIDPERGMTLKQSMDKLSEYAVKYMRNRFKFTIVAIQQQAMESEGLEAIKQKKMIPTVATLGDTKYTARDANLVVGLFDPSFFGLPNWLGYKIQDVDNTGLRNYGRFLYMLRGRDGEQGGICPLFFDGAVCDFEELPLPDDVNAISKYYAKVQNLKSYKQQKKFSALALLSFFRRYKKRRY